MLNEEIVETMIQMATDAMRNAYAPYNGVKTGACVLASDGTLYTGCSVENISQQLYVAAEQVAICKAISDGKREFDGIAVIGNTEKPFIPNGAVCQILAEFHVADVVMANTAGDHKIVSLSELAPYAEERIEMVQIARRTKDAD